MDINNYSYQAGGFYEDNPPNPDCPAEYRDDPQLGCDFDCCNCRYWPEYEYAGIIKKLLKNSKITIGG